MSVRRFTKSAVPKTPKFPAVPAVSIPIAPLSAEPLWTREEAANYLRIKPATIYQLTRRRSRHPLPYFSVGKYLRFRKSEIDRWLIEGQKVA